MYVLKVSNHIRFRKKFMFLLCNIQSLKIVLIKTESNSKLMEKQLSKKRRKRKTKEKKRKFFGLQVNVSMPRLI